MSDSIKKLSASAVAIAAFTIVNLMGIAVVTQFKTTGLVDNTTADAFISALAVFGTFASVVVIALIGKVVISLFQEGQGN